MKDFILTIFNTALIRSFLAFLFGATVMAPFGNGFTENPAWVIIGVLIFILGLWSLIVHYSFSDKTFWIIGIIILSYLGLIGYVLFQWG